MSKFVNIDNVIVEKYSESGIWVGPIHLYERRHKGVILGLYGAYFGLILGLFWAYFCSTFCSTFCERLTKM